MKLGLISDVHGDPVALELAWAHLTVLGASRVVCAGDVVGYGPLPDRAAAFLVERDIASVRGNHDRWALERAPGLPDPFGGGEPSRATLEYLDGLPGFLAVEGSGRVVVVVHAEPGDDMRFVTKASHPPRALDRLLDATKADVLVTGHTHEPMLYRSPDGRLIVNPGSVVGAAGVSTSRTFALLDLAAMTASHHDVETGEPVAVRPWSFDPAG